MFGIVLEGKSFLLAEVEKKGKGFDFKNLKTFTELKDVKQLYKGEFITGLNIEDVLIKTISLKVKSKRLIKKTLPFQVEALTALEKDNLLWCAAISKKDGRLVFHLTSKEALTNHLEKWQMIDPYIVSSLAASLYRTVSYFYKKEGVAIHFSEDKTLLIAIKDGQLINSCFIDIGLKNIKEAIALDKKCKEDEVISLKIDLQSPSSKLVKLCSLLKKFKEQIKEALIFVTNDFPFENYFLSGDIYSFKNLANAFIEKGNIHLLEENYAKHSLAIGLAIEALSSDKLQFRQESFSSKRYLRKCFLQGFFLFTLLFFSSFLVHKSFAILNDQKEKELHTSLTKLREKDPKQNDFLAISSDLQTDLNRFEESILLAQNQKNKPTITASFVLDLLSKALSQHNLKILSFSYLLEPRWQVTFEIFTLKDSDLKIIENTLKSSFDVKWEKKEGSVKCFLKLKG